VVSRGAFILHDAVRPALPDGAYELTVTQQLNPPGQSVDPLDKHLVVTGPRFALPPGQLLSSYPPNDAVGAFSSRLPQVVLRRRTLPWERWIDPADQTLPWLALVVLTDGEGHLTTGQPVDTTGLPDPDLRDSDTRDVLTVSTTVVEQIFPTKDDLPWLCHVREVDLTDTELALGDDDGWLAVVLANRLPQPGVKYTACLVSLEGHGDDLPTKEMPQDSFTKFSVYTADQVALAATVQRDAEQAIDQPTLAERQVANVAGSPVASLRAASGAPVTLVGAKAAAAKPPVVRDAWSAPALPATVATGQQRGYAATPTVTGRASVAGLSINPIFIEQGITTVQFTVLAHWSFTCDQGGDFESLMRELDDGMLGTQLPPATPTPAPGSPPPAPATRPDPVVTDTGHVATAVMSRRGVSRTGWYRGPFTPRQILRQQPDDSGVLPLLHAADQARRVGPDGREDLSLAAAFEIGRLLAVSQPAIVAGLLAWRKDGYGQARLRAILGKPGSLQSRLLQLLGQQRPVFSGGVAANLLGALGANGAARVGPVRPMGNPGPPLVRPGETLAGVVARGFGMDPGRVAAVLATGPGAVGLDPGATAPQVPIQLDQLGPAHFAGARAGLDARVTSLVTQAKLLGEATQ